MAELISQIAHAHQIARDAVEAEVTDITPSQARYLLALAEAGTDAPPSQTILTGKTKIDRSTLADVSKRLLRLGLISRRRTREDARRYAVKLTDAGLEKVKELKSAKRRIEARIRADLARIGVDIREVEAAE